MTLPSIAPVAFVAGPAQLPTILGGVLDAAIALAGADFGNIQLLGANGHLKIIVHRGFPDWWVEYWNEVQAGQGVCGSALAQGERVIVEDVAKSPIFVGTPSLDIQLKASIRAVQSTPLRDRSGRLLGMFSTHYRTPHRPEQRTLELLDLLAAHAVALIESAQTGQALQRAREQLVEAQKIAHLGSFEFDVTSGATIWSDEQYRIHGFEPSGPSPGIEDIVARCLYPEDRDRLRNGFIAAIEARKDYDQEHRILRSDGAMRWIHTRAHPHVDEQGVLLRYFGTTLDITERKIIEDALAEQANHLGALIKASPVGVFETDPRGKCIFVNDRWLEIAGLTRELVLGDGWAMALHAEDRERVSMEWSAAVAECRTFRSEYRFARPDGTSTWVFGQAASWFSKAGELCGYIGTITDISQRKLFETQIQERNAELADLYSSLQNLREEERNRLAQELHDDLGHLLTVIRMDADWVESRTSELAPNVAAKIVSISSMVDRVVDTVRRVVEDLRPAMLDELGLVAALDGYVTEFSAQSGIRCDISVSPQDLQTSGAVALGLYRIVQEALHNVATHAGASEATIVLRQDGELLILSIEDNGKGLPETGMGRRKGLGVSGMRERALALKGHFAVTSTPRQGVRVEVKIPV